MADLWIGGAGMIGRQTDLFPDTGSGRYPAAPGWKAEGPSKEAARKIAPRAGSLRAKVLSHFVAGYPATYTADEIARAVNISEFSARPRLTELKLLGWLEETAERRPNASGCMASAVRASRQAMEAANV
jgi:hypothetical protein